MRQRVGPERSGDPDRLVERFLVVEEREHQSAVVGPADLAERIRRAAPVPTEHRGVRRRPRRLELDRDPGHGRPCGHPDRAPADQRAGRPRLVEQRLEPLDRQRRTGGQGPLGLELDERRQPLGSLARTA